MKLTFSSKCSLAACVFFVCIVSFNTLQGGYWYSDNPVGVVSLGAPASVGGSSPVIFSKITNAGASVGDGTGGNCYAVADLSIDTYGTWTGTYAYSTPSCTASFSGACTVKHMDAPSHSGVQGTYRASGKVRASFTAVCSATSVAESSCGGATSASISTAGEAGSAEVSAIGVGCSTSGGYPVGFSVGGSMGGDGG